MRRPADHYFGGQFFGIWAVLRASRWIAWARRHLQAETIWNFTVIMEKKMEIEIKIALFRAHQFFCWYCVEWQRLIQSGKSGKYFCGCVLSAQQKYVSIQDIYHWKRPIQFIVLSNEQLTFVLDIVRCRNIESSSDAYLRLKSTNIAKWVLVREELGKSLSSDSRRWRSFDCNVWYVLAQAHTKRITVCW